MSGSPLSRRGLLLSAGALTAVGLAGCDLDPTSSAPAAEPSPDPDQAIVTEARAELSGLITRLGDATGTAALVAVHRVQLAALQGEPPTTAGGRPPLSAARVVARERRAADRFAKWATASESGDLARVLASIAAGIRMQPVLRGGLVSDPAELPALQRTLAAEHAAVYVFAALGGRAAVLGESPLRPALATAYDVHLARRNRLRVMVTAAGGDPVAAEPAYDVPRELTTPAQITAEALRVERSCVSTYAALVAGTAGPDRVWAVETLSAGALAELTFGGPPLPLPGLPAGFARG